MYNNEENSLYFLYPGLSNVSVYTYIQVCNNGYISMDDDLIYHSPLIPQIHNIVSPYGADIDTRISGTVRYTDGFITSAHAVQIPSIINFIKSQTNDCSFNGETRMMAVEWGSVAQLNGYAVSKCLSVLAPFSLIVFCFHPDSNFFILS